MSVTIEGKTYFTTKEVCKKLHLSPKTSALHYRARKTGINPAISERGEDGSALWDWKLIQAVEKRFRELRANKATLDIGDIREPITLPELVNLYDIGRESLRHLIKKLHVPFAYDFVNPDTKGKATFGMIYEKDVIMKALSKAGIRLKADKLELPKLGDNEEYVWEFTYCKEHKISRAMFRSIIKFFNMPCFSDARHCKKKLYAKKHIEYGIANLSRTKIKKRVRIDYSKPFLIGEKPIEEREWITMKELADSLGVSYHATIHYLESACGRYGYSRMYKKSCRNSNLKLIDKDEVTSAISAYLNRENKRKNRKNL